MSAWDPWIGREEQRTDFTDPGLLARWCATLDRAAPTDGTVPQGFHWCLCTPDAPTHVLGVDGHPRRDDSPDSFLPPVPLPRRMWASSRVEFLAPLTADADVSRSSRVLAVTAKSGGSGQLVFVDIAHETSCAGVLAVREVQSVVYREAAAPGTPPAPPPLGRERFEPTGWDHHRRLGPGPALLFRYSALTFNSHRIYYDAPYAIGEEGYRGLVVHGPLTATLLLDLAQGSLGDNALKTFAFRGLSPAVADEPLHLVMRGQGADIELWAFADDGAGNERQRERLSTW